MARSSRVKITTTVSGKKNMRVTGFIDILDLPENTMNVGEPKAPKKTGKGLLSTATVIKESALVSRMAGMILSEKITKARLEEEYAVAKFFQLLVASTPMDEEYTFERKDTRERAKYFGEELDSDFQVYGAGVRKLATEAEKKELKDLSRKGFYLREKIRDGGGARIDEATYRARLNIIDSKRKSLYESIASRGPLTILAKHIPDKDFVRGDWCVLFRGVKYKAFNTHNDGNESPNVIFTKDLFEKVGDEKAILTIANAFYAETEKRLSSAQSIVGGGFRVYNRNDKAVFLEYGNALYEKDSDTINKGKLYEHGVSNKHSVQAPAGFFRLCQALWESVAIDSSRKRNQHISKWLKKGIKRFKVNNTNAPIIKQFLKRGSIRTNEVPLSKILK